MDLASSIRARVAGLGDVELQVPRREPVRTPPDLDDERLARARRRR